MKKLKDKTQLMEAHRKLEIVKEDAGEFIKPEMEFVLVDDWDVQTDGKFDASTVVEQEVFGNLSRASGRLLAKKGHFRFREKQAVVVRDKTVEEEGSGTFVEQAIEAKTAAIATVKTSEGMAREALAVEAPRMDMAAILGMMPRAAGSSTDAAPAEPSETDEEEQTPTEPDAPDSDEDTAAEDRLLGHFGQTRRTPTPTAKPKTAAAKTTAKPNTSPGKTTPKPKSLPVKTTPKPKSSEEAQSSKKHVQGTRPLAREAPTRRRAEAQKPCQTSARGLPMRRSPLSWMAVARDWSSQPVRYTTK